TAGDHADAVGILHGAARADALIVDVDLPAVACAGARCWARRLVGHAGAVRGVVVLTGRADAGIANTNVALRAGDLNRSGAVRHTGAVRIVVVLAGRADANIVDPDVALAAAGALLLLDLHADAVGVLGVPDRADALIALQNVVLGAKEL